jgi:hypothetical protein
VIDDLKLPTVLYAQREEKMAVGDQSGAPLT